MELKNDCIRDVLLTVERQEFETQLSSFEIQNKIPEYELNDIIYTIKKLKEAGFLDVMTVMDSAQYIVIDITYNGHLLLNDIRDDKVWKKTKEHASKLSSVSISILQQLATATAKQMLGLQ
ncbi:DUF2513 domain-containing protein [Staphylococcus capitis]|uniref:DUF2513 domain-containing protein n=1 Tax=Staphylococcus capitis TaxID=29388 RepID=UPI0021A4CB05|nr:DUF2513 domain-containing protein [Staphylococcus capitis]MCT2015199.1 DUF2513 domain-containing protein [Staphylococcus capitis]